MNRVFDYTLKKYCLSAAYCVLWSVLCNTKQKLRTKNKIIYFITSKHNDTKPEINSMARYRTYTNSWKLNNELLNGEWVFEQITSEAKISSKVYKVIIQTSEPVYTMNRVEREAYVLNAYINKN